LPHFATKYPRGKIDLVAPLKQTIGFLAWATLVFAAAALGSLATSSSVGGWYQTLEKPTFTPPDWVFGPVWTALYLMMAIAAWLVWRKHGFAAAAGPLGLFLAQLALNTLWSFLFFAMRSPWLAACEILLLWPAIVATIAAFQRRSSLAAILLVPYLAWVTYAAALNVSIARMNS
jgi:tryptophan-rich sensory protein